MRWFCAFGGLLLVVGCNDAAEVNDMDVSAGVDASASNEAVQASPPGLAVNARAQRASDSATLVPVDSGDRAMSFPRVTGVAPAAAERIKTVLDQRRRDAIAERNRCRSNAPGQQTSYTSRAQTRYNRDALLSFAMSGQAFCGGANGTTITDALSF